MLMVLQGARSALGIAIPPNAVLYYDVELLRCLSGNSPEMGLMCCSQRSYPCQAPRASEAELTARE